MTEDCVRLDGMVFYGYHGARPEERTLGQRFIVDLALYRDVSDAAASDDVEHAADYSRIFREVREVMEGEPRSLLETLASTVAERVPVAPGTGALGLVTRTQTAPP